MDTNSQSTSLHIALKLRQQFAESFLVALNQNPNSLNEKPYVLVKKALAQAESLSLDLVFKSKEFTQIFENTKANSR